MNSLLKVKTCRYWQKFTGIINLSRREICTMHTGVKCTWNTTRKLMYVPMHQDCRQSTQLLHSGKCLAKHSVSVRTYPVVGKRTAFSVLSRSLSQHSSNQGSYKDRMSVVLYIGAAGIFMLGLGYAGVPLYRMFCQATGYGGSVMVTPGHDSSKVESMTPVKERRITVRFNADTASSMQWKFRPQQPKVELVPGETALAFYTAKNPTDEPVIGISTYNVIPFEAGLYFNKIQCFCFEEQRLNPHEQVDMPVFFFIDPEFVEDPKLENVDEITLSYTFFQAKEGMTLPLPGYMQQSIKQPQ